MSQDHFRDVCFWLGVRPPWRAPSDLPDLSDAAGAKTWRGEVKPLRLPPSPHMLHAQNRGRIFLRHTLATPQAGARYVKEALAAAYPGPSREYRLMRLLRYHPLDNDFWRMIYALMVQGGPVLRGEMVRVVYRLSHPDLADAEAERLYGGWLSSLSSS